MFDFVKLMSEIDNYITTDLLRKRQKEWEAVNPGTFAGIDIYLDIGKPIEKIKPKENKTTVVDDQKIGD